MATKSTLTLEIRSRLKKAVAELRAVETAIDEVGKSADETGVDLDQLSDDFDGMGAAAKKTAAIVTGAFVAATAAYASFETQTVNVQNITEATDETMAALAGRIMELPPALGEADDLMAGLYQTISSGITDTEGAFEVIVASAKAAKGNLADLGETVDAGTSILNAYNLEASDITGVLDAMTKTVDLGKLTFSDLSQNIGKGISIAAAAGVSYQELLATLATLTLNGLSVEESMVAIKNILVTGLKPTEQVSEAMKDLDVDMLAAALKAKGFGKWMADAAVAVRGNTEATAALFPNIRAMTGAMQLATKEGGEKWIETLDGIDNALGKNERNYARYTATVAGQTSALTTEFKKLGIEFGELTSEDAVGLIQALTGVITVMRDLDPEAQKLVITAGKAALAWGGMILVMPKLIAAYQGVTEAVGLTSAAMTTSRLTAGQVSLAFVAAAATGLLLADSFDKMNQAFLRFGGKGSGSAANAAAESTQALTEALAELYGSASEGIQTLRELANTTIENIDATLKNLKATQDEYEAMDKWRQSLKGNIIAMEKRKKKIAELEKIIKKAAEIEEKRKKALEASTKAEKENTDVVDDATGIVLLLTKEYEARLLVLDKSVDATEAAKKAAEDSAAADEKLIETTGLLGDELGLTAAEVEGATIWLRSMNDIVNGTWNGRAFVDLNGDIINISSAAEDAIFGIEQMHMVAGVDFPPQNFAGWRRDINEISDHFARSLGFAIVDGLAEFENFGDFFEGLLQDWSGMITDVLGGALSEAFSGEGFEDFGSNLMAGIQDLGMAGAVGGLAMVYGATQMVDQAAATINGIISGATAGAQAGGWVGAIIGGVLGGAAGYFGSGDGPSPETAIGISQSDVGLRTSIRTQFQGDRDIENELLMTRLNAAYSDVKTGYLDILRLFGDVSLFDLLGDLPEFFSGMTGRDESGRIYAQAIEVDAATLAEWITGEWMPDAFEDMIQEGLLAGFEKFNVSESKINELFHELDKLSGDARAQGLETFIRAVVNSQKLLEGMEFEEIIASATQGGRSAFVDYMEGVTSSAELLYAGFDDLTVLEGAEQANQMIALMDEARQREIQYLQQILQLSDDIERSIGGQIEGLQLGGMGDIGQAEFISGRISDLFTALAAEGIDPSLISRFTGDAQNYISMLQGLFGEDIDLDLNDILEGFTGRQEWLDQFAGMDVDIGGTGREFLISLLEALNAEAQEAIQENVDEIQALNEEHISILERLNLALIGFGDALEDFIPPGGDVPTDDPAPQPDIPVEDPNAEEGGKTATYGESLIISAIDRLAAAIMSKPSTKVSISENLAPFIRLATSAAGGKGFKYGALS